MSGPLGASKSPPVFDWYDIACKVPIGPATALPIDPVAGWVPPPPPLPVPMFVKLVAVPAVPLPFVLFPASPIV